MLNGKTVLITGGTGFFGNKFVETILREYPNVKKIVIYSHGEQNQSNMKQKYPQNEYPIPSEKFHEEIFTTTDSLSTIDLGKYYAILPSIVFDERTHEDYLKHYNATFVPQGFYYASNNNEQWDTVESLREKFRQVIPGFEVK